jgi:co-chaperonin GroES (HSP10)
MHFRPLHDRVLVRRIDAEERTAGGIIIPAKEKPRAQCGKRRPQPYCGPGPLEVAWR